MMKGWLWLLLSVLTVGLSAQPEAAPMKILPRRGETRLDGHPLERGRWTPATAGAEAAVEDGGLAWLACPNGACRELRGATRLSEASCAEPAATPCCRAGTARQQMRETAAAGAGAVAWCGEDWSFAALGKAVLMGRPRGGGESWGTVPVPIAPRCPEQEGRRRCGGLLDFPRSIRFAEVPGARRYALDRFGPQAARVVLAADSLDCRPWPPLSAGFTGERRDDLLGSRGWMKARDCPDRHPGECRGAVPSPDPAFEREPVTPFRLSTNSEQGDGGEMSPSVSERVRVCRASWPESWRPPEPGEELELMISAETPGGGTSRGAASLLARLTRDEAAPIATELSTLAASTEPAARRQRVGLLLGAGLYADLVDLLFDETDLEPQLEQALGYAYLHLDLPDAALFHLGQVLAAAPAGQLAGDARFGIGLANCELGDPEAAEASFLLATEEYRSLGLTVEAGEATKAARRCRQASPPMPEAAADQRRR